MIKQSTVLMAQPLANIATQKGVDLHEKAGSIIQGLNETTAAIVSFTEDNIAVELPDYTKIVPTHSEVMDQASTAVADTIRGSMYVISQSIKPLLKEVESRIRNVLSADSSTEVILNKANIEMVNIEPAFLNSPFYPQEFGAAFRDTNTIRLDSLLQGNYPRLSGAELVELISVDVPDLQPFFSNPSEVQNVYDALFVEKNWWTIINGESISNGVANITNPANYRFSNFRALVIATLLLNRIAGQDDPIDGVTGVSLEDYRSSLSMARDVLKTMLFQFKVIWETRAAAGIVILDNDVSYKPDTGGMTGQLPMLQGSITVGYNRAVLEMFADSNELSLSEYVLGFIYAKKRDYRVRDIITDKQTVVEAWREYRTDVTAALVANKGTVACKQFCQVLDSLYTKEPYKSIIEAFPEDVPVAQRISARVANQIDLGMFFSQVSLLDSVIRGDNALLNTQLGVILANAFDCPIAAEILSENAKAPAGTKEQQRKHLSGAIVKIILKRLFGK